MHIVIDISNQESRVCSLLANIVAWEQSLEVHRHEHQLSQEGHNPTPPFTEIHFSKTINTLNNTQYTPSVMAVIFCLAPSLHFTNCLQQSFSKLWFVQSTATGEQRRSGCDRHWKSNSLFVHVGKITGRGRHVIVAILVKLGSWRSHWWRPKATFMMPPTITILFSLCQLAYNPEYDMFFCTRTKIPMQSAHKSSSVQIIL